MSRWNVSLILVVCVGMTAAACAKKATPTVQPPPPTVAEARPASPPPPPDPAPPAPTTMLSDDELFARKTLAELNAERPLGTVYFDLDSSEVRDEARTILARNAEWLRRWPSTRITIEGHSDERGTAEYNLGLSDRRAQAVRTYLGSLGIDGDRVLAIGKGKEAPVCADSTEACWQQNRRGLPIITAK